MGILDMLFGSGGPPPDPNQPGPFERYRRGQGLPTERPYHRLIPDFMEPYLYGSPAQPPTGYQPPRGGGQSGDVMPTPGQTSPAERPNPYQPGQGSAQPTAFRPGLQSGQNYPGAAPYWDYPQSNPLPEARLPPGWQPPQQGPDMETLRRMMEMGSRQMPGALQPPAPVPQPLWKEDRRRGRPRMI